jgi:hypothetical protein
MKNPKQKLQKNLRHKLCQFIIKKYINGNINWPREIKIAQKLINKFNSFNFWINLKDLANKPPSLAWFLKPEGKAFLIKEYEIFNLQLTQRPIILELNKLEKDKNICKKPKTLIEFMRYAKKS